MITYDIRLCIGMDDPNKRVNVKCHDTGVNLRIYPVVCRAGKWGETNEPYHIPAGSTAVFKLAKPDKTYCVTDGAVESDDILVALPPQAFTVPGTAKAEVALFGPDGRRITSATFYILVSEECLCECETESESYVDVMGEQIQAAINAEQGAKDAAGQAEDYAKHPPIPKDGTWWVWNGKEYADSGEKLPEGLELPIASEETLGGIKVGKNLQIDKNGVLTVKTADNVEKDNTLPITSAAVHTEIGNIEVLLAAL